MRDPDHPRTGQITPGQDRAYHPADVLEEALMDRAVCAAVDTGSEDAVNLKKVLSVHVGPWNVEHS